MKRRPAARRQEERGALRALRLPLEDVYGPPPAKERADVTDLAASIARHGLLSPLVVRKNAQSGRYALVCGARRLAACRLLGMREADAVLLEGDEQEALACFLEEHWCHASVSCAQEAQMLGRAGAQEMLRRLAAFREAALRRLRLLSLGERALRLVRAEGLTLAQAEPLLMIPDEEKRLEAAAIIAQRGLSGRGARRLIAGERAACGGRTADGQSAVRDALGEISAACERLRARGVDARVAVRAQGGELCVRIRLKSGENLPFGQEKATPEEN